MKKKILVVEDERQYREILKSQLSDAGFDVEACENGQKALDFLGDKKFDLILLDLLMPKVDGIEFYHKLREKLKKKIPVIVLTNVSDTAAYDPNIKDVLIKSNVSIDEVVLRVKKAIN